MSEPFPGGRAEISDEEKQALVDRIGELLPEPTLHIGELNEEYAALLATILEKPVEDVILELQSHGEFGKKLEYFTASAKYALGEEHITLDWTDYKDGKYQTKVAVDVEPIRTKEGVAVSSRTTYTLDAASAVLRSRTWLFKGHDFTTEQELREIFTEGYLAPIMEKYRELTSMDGTKPIDPQVYWELLAKLDRLGPETIVYDPL